MCQRRKCGHTGFCSHVRNIVQYKFLNIFIYFLIDSVLIIGWLSSKDGGPATASDASLDLCRNSLAVAATSLVQNLSSGIFQSSALLRTVFLNGIQSPCPLPKLLSVFKSKKVNTRCTDFPLKTAHAHRLILHPQEEKVIRKTQKMPSCTNCNASKFVKAGEKTDDKNHPYTTMTQLYIDLRNSVNTLFSK
jgi:hypothetical protein